VQHLYGFNHLINWGGDAWRFFHAQVNKSELLPAFISLRKELKGVILFDLI
jgi:hypothetical protein